MTQGSSLIWRCRRGIKEMDLLLQRFIETRFHKLSEQEKLAFAELLDQQDPDIMDWILERSVPPTDTLKIAVKLIRDVNSPDNVSQ